MFAADEIIDITKLFPQTAIFQICFDFNNPQLTLTSKKEQPKVGQLEMAFKKAILASCTVMPLCLM